MKKLLVIVLCVAMMLTVLPGAASAEEPTVYVAEIAETGEQYESIQTAVDAAADGETVTIIADFGVECNSTFVTINEKSDQDIDITIDFNGKTINVTATAYVKELIKVNYGKLTLKDSSVDKTGKINVVAPSGVYNLLYVENTAELVIESGTYSLDKSVTDGSIINARANEIVTIDGGNFYLGNVAYASPWIFNVKGTNDGHVLVNGGTFNANILNQSRVLEVDQPYDKALKDNGDGTWSMVDAKAWVNNHNSDGKTYWDDGDGQSSLEDAVNKANNNATAFICGNCGENIITLLKDCTVSSTITVRENMIITVNSEAETIPKVTWNGTGKMFSVADGKTLEIKSGIYNCNVNEWCPEGYAAVENGDGLYEVVPGSKVSYNVVGGEENPVHIEGVATGGEAKGYPHIVNGDGQDEAIVDWYSTEDRTGDPVTFPLSIDGDKLLYGALERVYIVDFDTDASGEIEKQIIKAGSEQEIDVPDDPTKENHTFAGWYTEPEFTNAYDFNGELTGSVTLHAKWIKDSKIRFETYGGSAVADAFVPLGEILAKPYDPTKDGYYFGGWYTEEEFTNAYEFGADIEAESEITLYAKWLPLHTVSFVSNEGSEIGPVEVPDGALLTAPAAPTRSGYSFAGWYTDAECTAPYDFATPVTAPRTLYAKWNVIVYAPAYTVDAPAGVVLSPVNPWPGTTVNVILTDAGADGVRVVDAKGNPVRVSLKDGVFSFVMPYGDVAIVPFEVPFTDVAETDYFAEAMLWALANDITEGTSETTFSPAAPCTRAEMVTFLWRAAGCPAPAAAESAFTDIDPEAYYAKALLWAEEQGITAGSGDGVFSPNAACDRAQMAVFLQRMAKGRAVSAENSFADVAADAYYANAVQWALEQGITAGTGEGTYSPDAVCTRAQMVTFLWRGFGD